MMVPKFEYQVSEKWIDLICMLNVYGPIVSCKPKSFKRNLLHAVHIVATLYIVYSVHVIESDKKKRNQTSFQVYLLIFQSENKGKINKFKMQHMGAAAF